MKAERDQQYEENVALIARNAFLQSQANRLETELDHVDRQLQNVNRSQETLRRDRDYWRDLFHIVQPHQIQDPGHSAVLPTPQERLEAYQHARELTMLQQTEMLRAMQQSQSFDTRPGCQGLSQQANSQLAQAQNQQFSWHDCTCVPGRSAAFGILRTRDSDD